MKHLAIEGEKWRSVRGLLHLEEEIFERLFFGGGVIFVVGGAESECDDGACVLADVEFEGAFSGDAVFGAIDGSRELLDGIFALFGIWVFGAERLGLNVGFGESGVEGLCGALEYVLGDGVGFEILREFEGIDGNDAGIDVCIFGCGEAIFGFDDIPHEGE